MAYRKGYTGRMDECKDYFRRAIKIYGLDKNAWLGLFLATMGKNNFYRAITCKRRAELLLNSLK